jgi:mediator of RNA polymerase II transcription subunit 13
MQSANLKTFMQNFNIENSQDRPAFPQTSDVRAGYFVFIQSVLSSISRQLVSASGFIPMDSHTFFIANPTEKRADDYGMEGEDVDDFYRQNTGSIMSLSLYLSIGGTLVLSSWSYGQGQYFQVTNDFPETLLRPGMMVILSPGGLEATLESEHAFSDDNLYDDDDDDDFDPISTWKSLVHNWLLCKGINLAELSESVRWAKFKLQNLSSQEELDDPLFPGHSGFLWPIALCLFRRDYSQSKGIDDDGFPDSFPFFRQPNESEGYKDTLHTTDDWVLAKPNRDKIKDERLRRKETEAVQKQAEISAFDAASPFNTRGPYADSQALGGVYPTPPDGVISQNAGAITNSDHATAGGQQNANTLLSEHNDGVSVAVSDGHPSQLPQTTLANNDDYFGESDDDEMGGNDITDADFNFFDQPDDEEGQHDKDTEMQDVHSESLVDDKQEESIILVKQSPDEQNAEFQDKATDDVEMSVVKLSPQPEAKLPLENSHLTSDKMEHESKGQERKALNPQTVRQRLFSGTDTHQDDTFATDYLQRQSQFRPLKFNASINQSDKKYQRNGIFGQLSGTLSTSAKRDRNSSSLDLGMPQVTKKRRTAMVLPARQPKVKWDDDMIESSNDVSDASADDEPSNPTSLKNGTSPVKATFTESRLLPWSMAHLADTLKSNIGTYESDGKHDKIAKLPQRTRKDLLRFLFSVSWPESGPPSAFSHKVTLQPSTPSQSNVSSPVSAASPASSAVIAVTDQSLKPTDRDYIKIAQLVAEQIVHSASYDFLARLEAPDFQEPDLSTSSTKFLKAFHSAIDPVFPNTHDCDLLKFASLQDPDQGPINKNQPRPVSRRANTASGQSGEASLPLVMNLRTPHIRVRRNDGLLEILPPAIPFWETLGLAPASGPKNVMFYAILPGNDDLKAQAIKFLEQLGATYENCKLGTHSQGESKGGVIPLRPTQDNYSFEVMIRFYRHVCAKFGKLLADTPMAQGNSAKASSGRDETSQVDCFVIYLVNPFQDTTAIRELCAAFWLMYQAYSQPPISPSAQRHRPDIVLQILPVDYIISPGSPIVPEPGLMQRLAREVYDRCPPALPNDDNSKLKIYCGASIQLEEPIPKSITFKLASEPPSDLLHEPSHLHVGYARSGNWVTVAWTDSTGRYQAMSSYCTIGHRTFWEVAREIWQSTLEIMQARKVTWRVAIARAGIPEREETEAWASLATSQSTFQIITFLILIDPSPPMALYPKLPTLPTSTSGPKTPVDTSHSPRSGISPDSNTVATPAATPSEVLQDTLTNDPDAHLVDTTNEACAVILGHRVNYSTSTTDYRPSMSSGLIIKTSQTVTAPVANEETDDGKQGNLSYAAVHLIWIGTSNRTNPQLATTSTVAQPITTNTSGAQSNTASDTTPSSSPPTQQQQQQSHQQPQLGGTGNMFPKNATDGLLRDMLGTYRNLACLATVRGLKGTKDGLLPWHIIVAMRGAEGLNEVMGV